VNLLPWPVRKSFFQKKKSANNGKGDFVAVRYEFSLVCFCVLYAPYWCNLDSLLFLGSFALDGAACFVMCVLSGCLFQGFTVFTHRQPGVKVKLFLGHSDLCILSCMNQSSYFNVN
jgi:hypothetical protein